MLFSGILLLITFAAAEPMIQVESPELVTVTGLDSSAGAFPRGWFHATGGESSPRMFEVLVGDPGTHAGKGGVLIFDFLDDLFRWLDGFRADSDERHGGFHALYLHPITERWPGLYIAVVASGVAYEALGIRGSRDSGSVGVQLTLLGARVARLRENEGQLVLRVLPIGGTFEKIVLDGPTTGDDGTLLSPDAGLIVRPGAELESSYRLSVAGLGFLQPGGRLMVQPRLTRPGDTRILAEAYLKVGLSPKSELLRRVSFVPRCVMDLSTEPQERRALDSSTRNRFGVGDRFLSCWMNLELEIGM